MSETQDIQAEEEWRAVVGYEGLYEVSDLGRVRSLTTMVRERTGKTRTHYGRIVSRTGKLRYTVADLYKDGHRKTVRASRLVLNAFVGPCPEGMEACHFPDKDRQNNRLENLRWGTRTENDQHRLIQDSTQKGERHWNSKLTAEQVAEIRRMCREKKLRQREIAVHFGVRQTVVSQIHTGKRWGHVKCH